MSTPEAQFRKIITELRVAIAAVDVVLFTIFDATLHVFLAPINKPPYYTDMHGLPGGIIGPRESSEEAAARHLKEKVHIDGVTVEQLYTFSNPDRDKRSRSISVAYIALVSPEQITIGKNREGEWVSIKALPKLAYDHAEIIAVALERLKSKLIYTNIAARLLPKQFTLPELQKAYEIILNQKLDKRNFRKRILSLGLVKSIGKKKKTLYRPAELYRFIKRDTVVVTK